MKKIILNLYPYLIACYPVLALRNHNILYVDLASIIRTLCVAIGLTAVIWVFTYLIFRDWGTSGIVTSLTLILIFSYGHIQLQSQRIFGEPIRHSYLAAALGILFLFFAWLAIKNPIGKTIIGNFLATTAAILVVMSVAQSLYHEYNVFRATEQILGQHNQTNITTGSRHQPDIYLIVLDGHGRADVLMENFGYDSSDFVQELTNMGFYVADCSQSNYASTNLSLSALLNIDYIPPTLDKMAKLPAFNESTVLRTLDSNGYTVITFENRASGHFDLQEDIRLSQNQLAFGELNFMGGLNEFETVMLNTSLIKLFLDTRLIPGFNEDTLTKFEEYEHYQQTHFILSKMREIPGFRSPKFVFVHIMVPHSPFIFTPDGSFRYPEDNSKSGYRDNVEFIDNKILEAIRALLEQSEQSAVIILMGDHGPPTGRFATQEDRMPILNAFYVNDEAKANLYASISPVNSFRVILNEYFGGNYPLLEDVSYPAYKIKQLSDGTVVENTCVSAVK